MTTHDFGVKEGHPLSVMCGCAKCQATFKAEADARGVPEAQTPLRDEPDFVHTQRQCGGCGLMLSACICELEKLPSGMIQPDKPWPRAAGVPEVPHG